MASLPTPVPAPPTAAPRPAVLSRLRTASLSRYWRALVAVVVAVRSRSQVLMGAAMNSDENVPINRPINSASANS